MEMEKCGEGFLGTEYISFLLLLNPHFYSFGLAFLLLRDMVSCQMGSEGSCKED